MTQRRSRDATLLGGARQVRGKGVWYIILAAEVDPERKLIHPAKLGLPSTLTEDETRLIADQMSRQAKEDEHVRRAPSPKADGEMPYRDWADKWHAWREGQGIVETARHDRGQDHRSSQ